MALIVKATADTAKAPPIEAGTYPAVCFAVIDLGVQYNEIYGNYSRKVALCWEIPGETIEIEGEIKNRIISKTYTASLNEKAKLRADLEAWRGLSFTDEELSGFDLKNILGAACFISVVHNKKGDRTYVNIGSVSKISKGTVVEKPQNDFVYFDLDMQDAISQMEILPEWAQKKIKESVTYSEIAQVQTNGNEGFDIIDDTKDLPF